MTQFTDAQKNSLITTTVQESKKQYGVVTDVLSVGEIEGLVGGLSGVFYNGTSLLNSSTSETKRGRIGSCRVNGNLVTNAGDLFKDVDLALGDYYIQIYGTEEEGSVTSYTPINSTIQIDGIAYKPNTITNSYRTNVLKNRPSKLDDELKNLWRFPQLEEDSQDWTGVYTDGLYPPPPKSVLGETVLIDGIYKITTKVSNSSVILDDNVNINRNTTNVYCKLSRPINAVSSTDLSEELSYADSFCIFRPGKPDQAPITEVRGIPSASFLIAPNQELLWHNSCSGVDQDGNAIAGTASTYFIDSTSFNFGQFSAEAVDKLKLTIEFPAGLRHNGKKGEERNTYAEFQVVFNKGSVASNTYLALGRDYGGDSFDDNVPSWDAGNINTARNFYEYPDGPRYSRGVVHKKGNTAKFVVEFEVDIRSLNLDQLTPSTNPSDVDNLYGWRIGIKRLSPQSLKEYALDDNNFQGTAVLKTVEAIFTDSLTYPNTAYATVGFSAEDFPSPPKRSYLIRGRKIKVPTNYFTREETGSSSALYTRNTITGADAGAYQDWDGSFRGDLSLNDGQDPNFYPVYCNNPAWVFYDILTNKDFGLGNYLSEDDIDIYALYQIARYCDELIPDGLGGSEPRFTCNVYLQGQTEAYKVLKDLASVFRGMMYWIDGKITAVQDRPKEPVYTFNKGNVKDGSFSYTYTGQRARTNQVNVTWNNPRESYKNTVLTIDDFDNIGETGKIVPTDVVAFGCTSEAQARRVGLWTLATNINETELVSFSTSINANFLRPGDIINVADSNSTQVLYSGRTTTGSTANLIQLDRDVSFLSTGVYFLQLLYPEPGVYLDQGEATIGGVTYFRGALINGVLPAVTEENALNLTDDSGNAVITQYSKYSRIESQEIVVSGSSNNEISVNTNFSQAPNNDVIWNITYENENFATFVKKYRILAIEEDKDQYTFTASYYFRDKFEELELERKVTQPSYIGTSGATDLVPSPTNLAVVLSPGGANSDDGGGTTYDAVISWTPPTEAFTDSVGNTNEVPYRFLSSYELQHTFSTPNSNTGFTTTIVEGNSTSYTYPGASGGRNTVRIRTINDLGVKSNWTYVSRDIFSAGNSATGTLGGVSTGGSLTSATSFSSSTGTVYIQDSGYVYTPPSVVDYVVETATANQAGQVLAVSAVNPTPTTDANGTANVNIDQPDQWHHISESYYTLKSKIYSRSTNVEVLNLSFYTDFNTSYQTGVIGIVHDSIAVVLDEGTSSIRTIDIATGDLLDDIVLGNDITLGYGYHFCKDNKAICSFNLHDKYSIFSPYGVQIPIQVGVNQPGSGYTTATAQFIPDTGGSATVTLNAGGVQSVTINTFPFSVLGGVPNIAIIGDGFGAVVSADPIDDNFGSTFIFDIDSLGIINTHSQYFDIAEQPGPNTRKMNPAGLSDPANNFSRKNLVDFDPDNEKLWIGYSANNSAEPLFSGLSFRGLLNGFKDKRDTIVRWDYSPGWHGYTAVLASDWNAQNYIVFGFAYYRYTPQDILDKVLGARLTGLACSGNTLVTSWGDSSNLYLAKYTSSYLATVPEQPDDLLEITGIVTGTPRNLITTSESSEVTFFWYAEDPQTVHQIDNDTWTEIATITPPGTAFSSIWELDIVEGTEDALLVITDQASSGNDGRAHVYSWAPNNSTDLYWFFDYSTRNTDPWKTLFLQTDPNVQDLYGNNLSFSYWTEAGGLRLSSIAGTVATTLGSTLVTGSGTSFTSDFVDGDFIRVSFAGAESQPSDSEYRFVAQILSDTSLIVETPFLRTRSGAFGAKNSFTVDYARDAILAKASKNNNGTFTYTPYVITQQGADRSVGYDATDFSIEYNSSGANPVFVGADTVSPAGNATDIRIYGSTSNFSTPEYEFSVGGTILQAFSTVNFFDWTVPSTKTSNSTKVDIIVREQAIPDLQASVSFTITSTTTAAVVVLALTSTDTTIEYDGSNQNPVFVGADTVSPAGNATDIRLTGSILSGSIATPEYQFYLDGSIVQAFSTSDFYDYTIPTTKTVNSFTFLIEAREVGTSVVLSSASLLITNTIGVTSYTDSDVDTHLNTGTAATGEVLSWDGADYDWVAQSVGYTDSDVDTHLNTGTAGTGEVLSWDGADYDWVAQSVGYTDSDVDTHLNTGTAGTGEVLSWDGADYDWVAQSGGSGPTISTTTNTAVNPASTSDVAGATYSSMGDSHTWTSSGGTTLIIVDQSYSITGGGQSTSTGRWRIQDITGTPITIFDPFEGVAFSGTNAEFPNDWFGTECHNFLYTPAAGSRTIELQWNTNDGQAILRRLEWTTIEF